MLMSHYQNAGQCHNIRTISRAFENVEKLKYFAMTLTNQHLIHEEIKHTLNCGNIYYNSVQHLVLHLLHKNVKIKTHKTTIFQIYPHPWQTHTFFNGFYNVTVKKDLVCVNDTAKHTPAHANISSLKIILYLAHTNEFVYYYRFCLQVS
jgi:sarcosine oxidase delta subunit